MSNDEQVLGEQFALGEIRDGLEIATQVVCTPFLGNPALCAGAQWLTAQEWFEPAVKGIEFLSGIRTQNDEDAIRHAQVIALLGKIQRDVREILLRVEAEQKNQLETTIDWLRDSTDLDRSQDNLQDLMDDCVQGWNLGLRLYGVANTINDVEETNELLRLLGVMAPMMEALKHRARTYDNRFFLREYYDLLQGVIIETPDIVLNLENINIRKFQTASSIIEFINNFIPNSLRRHCILTQSYFDSDRNPNYDKSPNRRRYIHFAMTPEIDSKHKFLLNNDNEVKLKKYVLSHVDDSGFTRLQAPEFYNELLNNIEHACHLDPRYAAVIAYRENILQIFLRDPYLQGTTPDIVPFPPTPKEVTLREMGGFNVGYYLRYTSVTGSIQDALHHYCEHGIDDGFSPNPYFVPDEYLNNHSVALASYKDTGVDGKPDYRGLREHWLTHGIREGWKGCNAFHLGFYLDNHNNLADSDNDREEQLAQAFEHWILHGKDEPDRITASPDIRMSTEFVTGSISHKGLCS